MTVCQLRPTSIAHSYKDYVHTPRGGHAVVWSGGRYGPCILVVLGSNNHSSSEFDLELEYSRGNCDVDERESVADMCRHLDGEREADCSCGGGSGLAFLRLLYALGRKRYRRSDRTYMIQGVDD